MQINISQDMAKEDKMEEKANAANEVADKKEVKKKQGARIEELEKTVAEKDEQIKQQKDENIRIYAEFDTWRRRTAKEILDSKAVGSREIIDGLLPVLDDCERALKALEQSNDSDAAKEGTQLIYNKLMAYLKSKGLEPIDALGKDFDTDVHEAVAQFPVQEEEKKNKVFDVVQTGYTYGGKVIRFAKVVVGI